MPPGKFTNCTLLHGMYINVTTIFCALPILGGPEEISLTEPHSTAQSRPTDLIYVSGIYKRLA